MTVNVGVWIDHKQAVIVSASAGHVTAETLQSDVAPHPHFGGSQEGGGEKKYEERREHELHDYYDEVIDHLGQPESLLILGPGEAKGELESRLGHLKTWAKRPIAVETADRLSEPEIVAKVKEHFGLDM